MLLLLLLLAAVPLMLAVGRSSTPSRTFNQTMCW